MADISGHATFGQRLVAIIVDHIILWIISVIIAIPIGIQTLIFTAAGMQNPWVYAQTMVLYGTLSFIIWLIYFTYFEGKNGQTPGKMAMGIKVVRESGNMTYGAALIRSILRIIDWLPFVYILGFIVALASKNNQRIGDLAARTMVVKA